MINMLNNTKDEVKEFNFKEKLREILSLGRFGKGKDNDEIFDLFDDFIKRLKEVLREDGYAKDDIVLKKIDKLAGDKYDK